MIKKRIIVIDDEPLISTLIKEMIAGDQEIEISEIVTHKKEFLDLVFHHPFDAALIDISVEGREGGLDILNILRLQKTQLPSIILSAYDEIDYALKCLQLGAKGYLNKRYICMNLKTAFQEVFDGNLFVSGDYGKYIVNQYRSNGGSFSVTPPKLRRSSF
jgi:DNA-binding NarL/FixJ family response regulator